MNEIFAAANAAGIEIIPLLNSPGHHGRHFAGGVFAHRDDLQL